jgi:signal transduction histidine kinase/ligand-binding sensor domain-containing protein
MIKRFFELIFFFTLCMGHIHSQVIFDDYTFESWSTKDGLPTDLILNIAIDTNNFIWFNTYEGLVQFDGVKFNIYSAALYPEIKSNNIYSPVIDKNNTLWATTQFGSLIQIKNGKLKTYTLPYQMDRIVSEFDNGDYLSFTPKGERVIFNPYTQSYKSFNRDNHKELARALNSYTEAPYRMVKLEDGRKLTLIARSLYWLGTDSLESVDLKYGVPPLPWSAAEIIRTSQNEILLVGDDMLKVWEKNKFVTYPGFEKVVINTTGGRQQRLLAEDKNGNLWLGTATGPVLRRKGNTKFEFLPESHPLRAKIVTAIQVDSENNIWVGTERGVFKITEGKIKMISKYKDMPFLRTGGVTQLPSGALYINVPGRTSLYNYHHDEIKPVDLNTPLLKLPWEAFHMHADRHGNVWLASAPSFRISPDGKEFTFGQRESIRYVYEDSTGQVWFGVSSRGIGYLDGDSLKYLKFDDFSFSGHNISSVKKINGNEWLLTSFNTGLIWIDSKGAVTKIYDTLGYPGIGAFITYQDRYGSFWVASTNGLFYFNGTTFIKIKDHHAYLNTSFFEIVDDLQGSLWLTSNKGIIQISKNELEEFTNGKIPAVNALLYDEGDGMLNRQATGARHSILTKEGLIMIPTLQGLAIVAPANMVKNSIPPHVVINGLYFNSKLIDTTAPVFDAGVHQYVFDFSATSYVAPSKVQFKYILEGYDKEWSKLTTERKVTYTNLPKGSYTFKVKASNNDGIWNEDGASLSFTVKPYLYETWWFRLSTVLALAGIGYSLFNWRSKQILDRNKELQILVDSRTSELNNSNKELSTQKISLENTLHALQSTQAQLIQSEKMASLGELTAGIAHEIQNPLNFVNNFSELNYELVNELSVELAIGNTQQAIDIANDIKINSEKINHHGKRAESIVKGMLEHSRKSSGTKEPTDINKLCDEFVRLSYHGLRAKDPWFNCEYKLVLDPNLPLVSVVSQDIGRVLLNIINNAFQACAENLVGLTTIPPKDQRGLSQSQNDYKPLVSVSTKHSGDKVEISITDNGPGIPDSIKDKIFQPFFTTKPTGQGTGLGLSLAYDIIKAHGGIIKFNSSSNGSVFTIQLPIQTI